MYVVGFTTGQVGDLPHWGFLRNQSQIGLLLFAETLQFVQGTVEAALQTAFLAVEHVQRLVAAVGYQTQAFGVVQFEACSTDCMFFHLERVKTSFHMVEAAEAPGGHR